MKKSPPRVRVSRAQVLGLAVRALYAAPPPVGHGYLPECVRAAAAVALNPAASQQTCVAAVQLLDATAAQLAAFSAAVAAKSGGAAAGPGGLLEPPSGSGDVSGLRSPMSNATSAGKEACVGWWWWIGSGLVHSIVRLGLHTIRFDRQAERALCALFLLACGGAELGRAASGTGGAPPPPHPAAVHHWTLLLLTCAEVLSRQDARPLVANAAAQLALTMLGEHSAPARWPDAAWAVLLVPLLSALFHVPLDVPPGSQLVVPALPAGAAAFAPAPAPQQAPQQEWGAAGGVPAAEFVSRAQHYLPACCEQLARPLPAAVRRDLLWQLGSTALQWMQQVRDGSRGPRPLSDCKPAARRGASSGRALCALGSRTRTRDI